MPDNRENSSTLPPNVFENSFRSNEVVIAPTTAAGQAPRRRILNLNEIQTPELKLLSPTRDELRVLKTDRKTALINYSERLRSDYRQNTANLREGFRLLSDAIKRGEQITVTCACRNGAVCHSDVVKMAIEKIHWREKKTEVTRTSPRERTPNQEGENKAAKISTRTLRAVNEILASSASDKLIAGINQTEGRSQSEQASFLGKSSQFVRDLYEHGASVVDGSLVVPREKLAEKTPLEITTLKYAVSNLNTILGDDLRARDLAPKIVEYGNQIAGSGADSETKLKVFGWIYETIGRPDYNAHQKSGGDRQNSDFNAALKTIAELADEMRQLEPIDRIELVPLTAQMENAGNFEATDTTNRSQGEELVPEEIYEEAINRQSEDLTQPEVSALLESEPVWGKDGLPEKAGMTDFDRTALNGGAPDLPSHFTDNKIKYLFEETLPEIDRQLENGTAVKEILKPFNEMVWQSERDATLNRLEALYKELTVAELAARLTDTTLTPRRREQREAEKSRMEGAALTPTKETLRELLIVSRGASNQSVNPTGNATEKQPKTVLQICGKSDALSEKVTDQLQKIDIYHTNVIEIKHPGEFLSARTAFVSAFFQKSKQEIAAIRSKLDGLQLAGSEHKEAIPEEAKEYRKLLSRALDATPKITYKLEGSTELINGISSPELVAERELIGKYIEFQLTHPDVRLRHENERFRIYAATLESAKTRDDIVRFSSEIRAENASLGLRWKNLDDEQRTRFARPLTQKEMQFLFTESSPQHYTNEMTAMRLAFAHAGASRRAITQSLVKGEIAPSPEAQRLIKSLASRLERQTVVTSMQATKHFLESLSTPNESLKIQNDFDHFTVYKKLPPAEKDFIYYAANHQKENLEYRLGFQRLSNTKSIENVPEKQAPPARSRLEKSLQYRSLYYQARVLGANIQFEPSGQNTIIERDIAAIAILVNNQSPEKLNRIGEEFAKSSKLEDQQIGEVLATFSQAEKTIVDNRLTVHIHLPERSSLAKEDYDDLLDKIYQPSDQQNFTRFSGFARDTLRFAHEKGMDETISNWRNELSEHVYRKDAHTDVFSVEKAICEKLDAVQSMQGSARTASRENEQLLKKYTHVTAQKLAAEKKRLPSSAEQLNIVSSALAVPAASFVKNKTNNRFFEMVQKMMTISDLNKFHSNRETISIATTRIRTDLNAVSREHEFLEKNKINFESIGDSAHPNAVPLKTAYETTQAREETAAVTRAARLVFEIGIDLQGKTLIDLVDSAQLEKIKYESFTAARRTLEPQNDLTGHPFYMEQANTFIEKINEAHNLSQRGAASTEIDKAFAIAQNEKSVLDELSKPIDPIIKSDPVSLKIFETELANSESEIFNKIMADRLADKTIHVNSEQDLTSNHTLTADELAKLKGEAWELAKSRLEPVELNALHDGIPQNLSRQAFRTFKQLDQAADLYQSGGDPLKTKAAFQQLDRDAAILSFMREKNKKSESLAVLKEGIKTDLANIIKNTDQAGDVAERVEIEINKIVAQNLAKSGFGTNGTEAVVDFLSEKISGKFEQHLLNKSSQYPALNSQITFSPHPRHEKKIEQERNYRR